MRVEGRFVNVLLYDERNPLFVKRPVKVEGGKDIPLLEVKADYESESMKVIGVNIGTNNGQKSIERTVWFDAKRIPPKDEKHYEVDAIFKQDIVEESSPHKDNKHGLVRTCVDLIAPYMAGDILLQTKSSQNGR